jgi:hypothetical protein
MAINNKVNPLIKKLPFLMLVFLLIVVILSVFIVIFINPSFNLSDWIGIASTLTIAIMTIGYVAITFNQLSVMQDQISEMKISRELLAQPLLVFQIQSFIVEKPRLYYTPPEDKYSWMSLCKLKCIVKNYSNFSCINIHIIAKILFKYEEKNFELPIYPKNIEALAENSNSDEENLFFDDDELTLPFLKAITQSEGSADKCILEVKIFYKNLLGAYFTSKHNYWLRPIGHTRAELENMHEKYMIFDNWISNMHQFETSFRNEFNYIQTLTPWKSENWIDKFQQLKKLYADKLIGEEQEITVFPLSSDYSFQVITKEQYEIETS